MQGAVITQWEYASVWYGQEARIPTGQMMWSAQVKWPNADKLDLRDDVQISTVLDELGRDGWELVNELPAPGRDARDFRFKRPKGGAAGLTVWQYVSVWYGQEARIPTGQMMWSAQIKWPNADKLDLRDDVQISTVLDELGRDGWELVNELPARGRDARDFRFKRPTGPARQIANRPRSEKGALRPAGGKGLDACVRDLETAQRLATSEPDRADYQRKLAGAYNDLGDAQRALGKRAEALDSYTRRLQVTQRLASGEPDRVDYQRRLATAYDELGDAQRALGKPAEAVDSYTHSVQIMQRLAGAEPDRVDHQRKLAIAHSRLGDITADMGDNAAAGSHFSADLRITRRVLSFHPESTNATVDVAESLRRLASVHDDPRPRRTEAVAILEQLEAQGRLNKRGAAVLAQIR